MIEEIKAMIEKEEMSTQEEAEQVKEEVLEELSAVEPVEKVNHNPEAETKKKMNLFAQNRPQSTMDRVLAQISKINN